MAASEFDFVLRHPIIHRYCQARISPKVETFLPKPHHGFPVTQGAYYQTPYAKSMFSTLDLRGPYDYEYSVEKGSFYIVLR